MRIQHFLVIALSIALTAAGAALAGDPKDPPKEAPKEEAVDLDVLHKVRKLIRGTLSADEKEREKAWNEIRDMGNLAVPGLIGVYRQKSTTPEEVRSILLALGDSRDPRAGPALAELLASPDGSVRRDAARAMGDSGYKGGIPALEKVSRDAKEQEEVRLFAATAAAKLGSADAQNVLAELLKSQHPEIRSRAVFALGKYGGIGHVADIEKALDDSDSSVREDAVEALRLLKKEPAWPGLVKATADSDYKIRNAAMDALRQVTGQQLENDPKAWQEWLKNGAKPPAKDTKVQSRKVDGGMDGMDGSEEGKDN